jgi:N-acetylneuraminic acid mutarotase
MNRSLAIILLLAILTASCMATIQPAKASSNPWVEKAPMPTGRFDFGAATVNGTIYAIGGIIFLSNGAKLGYPAKNFETTTDVNEAYDPATNTWVEKAPMPPPNWLDSFGIAVYKSKIYCIGGPANNVYDTAKDTWEIKTPMPTPRRWLDANVVDGKIYLIGGRAMGKVDWSPYLITYDVSAVNEVYDPVTDSWTEKASMPNAVASYASAVVDNKIYVISGCTPMGNVTGLVQIYDPQTDKWSLATPIPNPVENAAAGAITNTAAPSAIYVIGGSIASDRYRYSQNLTQVYSPENDSWTMGPPMIANRYALSVAVVNDVLYAIGGASDSNLYSSNTYQYAPAKVIPSNSTESPSPSPSPSPPSLLLEHVCEIAATVIIILVIAGGIILLLYLRKRDHSAVNPLPS